MSFGFEIFAGFCLATIAAAAVRCAIHLGEMAAIMREDAGLDAFNEAMTSAPVEKPARRGPNPRVKFGE